MKKKLAGLDVRIQLGAIGFGLLLFALLGYMFVVSPKGAQATKIQKQTDEVQTQIFQRKAQIRAGMNPPSIQTADLFRLARAMPDREDMPGIILTLSDLARSSGIKFDLIEPVAGAAPSGSFATNRIHLLFNGDFYGLSDFLYRLRSLVAVHDGKLDAKGRLFNVDTLTFNVGTKAFPKIAAELFVNAYVYGSAVPVTPAAPETTTPEGTTEEAPAGATAAGATP